jgi:hypothetical protein
VVINPEGGGGKRIVLLQDGGVQPDGAEASKGTEERFDVCGPGIVVPKECAFEGGEISDERGGQENKSGE